MATGSVDSPSTTSCDNPTRTPLSDLDPVQYIVTFPDAKRHYVHVTATVPSDGRDEVELMMAVWTPGSYLVREYARHVENLVATTQDGAPLRIAKTRKNRWTVETHGQANILLTYDVYGRDMTVRTNWVEADWALLNGAPTFITRADSHRRRHDVRINPPRAWRKVVTGLATHKDSRLHFKAPDFDTLVDSPLLIGNPELHEFEVDKTPHVLANLGGEGIWESGRSATDTQRLVEEEAAFWGQMPYDDYAFINILAETGGGLEHKNSTVMMYTRWATRDREKYLKWLGLVAHEFFHTWNVKRLRPQALGPFDYENEVHTESMWVAEGITSYYDDLIVHRAGLSTEEEYLTALSRSVKSVMTGPGRLVQSLSLSSYDAWIKLYRRDENFANSGVNYYTKGALVAWLLDGEIRKATGFKRSLDDVMRAAYEKYSGECGFTEAQFRQVVSDVAGTDMSEWLARHVDGTDDLDFSTVFELYGLRFKPVKRPEASGPQEEDPWYGAPKPRFGFEASDTDGRLLVKSVTAGDPAAEAGLNAGDELIAVQGVRVSPSNYEARLKGFRPGESLEFLVARRDSIMTLEVTPTAPLEHEWTVEADPDANDDQVTRRRTWLTSSRKKS
ncbi:MAG: PDZ domain-containing protein [Myxococcota bacterium]